MGALAGLLKAQGHEVTGCDTALYPPMREAIAKYGIPTRTGFDPSHLEPPPDVLIVGNAVHADNPEAVAAIEEGVEYLSMAEAIRQIRHSRQEEPRGGGHAREDHDVGAVRLPPERGGLSSQPYRGRHRQGLRRFVLVGRRGVDRDRRGRVRDGLLRQGTQVSSLRAVGPHPEQHRDGPPGQLQRPSRPGRRLCPAPRSRARRTAWSSREPNRRRSRKS